MGIEVAYLRIIKERSRDVKTLGDKTIEQLSADDMNWRLNEESNSIAVIVKHLNGNMISRWTDFLHSDGEKSYRKRDQEFVYSILSKTEVINIWEKGWNIVFEALNSLKEKDLLASVYIRGERHLVIDAIERQLAHYAYHIGQIVHIGKQIKGENWDSLSIPKGKSEEYLQQMLKKHQTE